MDNLEKNESNISIHKLQNLKKQIKPKFKTKKIENNFFKNINTEFLLNISGIETQRDIDLDTATLYPKTSLQTPISKTRAKNLQLTPNKKTSDQAINFSQKSFLDTNQRRSFASLGIDCKKQTESSDVLVFGNNVLRNEKEQGRLHEVKFPKIEILGRPMKAVNRQIQLSPLRTKNQQSSKPYTIKNLHQIEDKRKIYYQRKISRRVLDSNSDIIKYNVNY